MTFALDNRPSNRLPDDVLLERLLEKTIRDGVTTCWLWIGACVPKGYGRMWDGEATEYAHRISFRIHHGPISEGFHVCHRCDVSACINPDHLWEGTARMNVLDCLGKGRLRPGSVSGEKASQAKLLDAEVEAIRDAQRGYGTGVALAYRYGVSPGTVSMIRNGHARAGYGV
jgi:hypothetical protein